MRYSFFILKGLLKKDVAKRVVVLATCLIRPKNALFVQVDYMENTVPLPALKVIMESYARTDVNARMSFVMQQLVASLEKVPVF